MSGLEIIGSIVAIIDFTLGTYNVIKDFNDLPETFKAVGDRLPIVKNTLSLAENNAKATEIDAESVERITNLLDGCKEKVKKLRDIFEEVETWKAKPFKRTWNKLWATVAGKKQRVESLMKAILEDVLVLGTDRMFQMATTEHMAALHEAIEDLANLERENRSDKGGISQTHFGPGDNVAGDKYLGNHNENHGSGTAYFAPVTQHPQNPATVPVRERLQTRQREDGEEN